VPALEQEVGAGHHPAVGGGQHRGVVTQADQDPRVGRTLRQHGGDLRDKAEFAERGDVLFAGVLFVRSDQDLPRVSPVWTSTVA